MWTTVVETNVAVGTSAPPPMAPEWVQLAQVNIAVSVPVVVPPVEWVQLAQVSLGITVPAPAPPIAWVVLAQEVITVKIPGVVTPPVVPPVVPPEEAKFPWVPVALIGGGLVAAVAAMKPKKKKT